MNHLPRFLGAVALTTANLFAQSLNWTARSTGVKAGLEFTNGVFGGGKFAVLAGNDIYNRPPPIFETQVAMSVDGVTWTVGSLPENVIGSGIAYGNGLYVVASQPKGTNTGSTKNIHTSSDGVTWTSRDTGSGPLYAVASAVSRWVAVGTRTNGFNAVTSTDCVTWTRIAVGQNSGELSGVVADSGSGMFVAWGQLSGDLWIADGSAGILSWSKVTLPTATAPSGGGLTVSIIGIVAAGGKFVALLQDFLPGGTRARLLSSPDGSHWSAISEFSLPVNFSYSGAHPFALSADPNSGRATAAIAGGRSISGPTPIYTPLMHVSAIALTSWVSQTFGNNSFFGNRLVIYGDGIFVTGNSVTELFTAAVSGGDFALPIVTIQPAAQTTAQGGNATFVIAAVGSALSYQWLFNNSPLAGANSASFTISAATSAKAGSYSVRVTNQGGTVTSNSAALTVNATPATITTQPLAQSVISGGSATLAVTATGTELTYQWFLDNTAITGATAASYIIPAVSSATAGNYTVRITNSAGTTTSEPATLTVIPTIAFLNNLSVRARAGSSSETLIVGVTVGGSAVSTAKTALIRGVGPTLAGFGVTGFLADPVLSVLSGTTVIASNDDWNNDATIASTSTAVGAFPLLANSRDAALFGSGLGNGSYTVQVTGKAGATGNALVELYDTAAPATITATTTRFTNVSARTFGGTAAETLIVGFNVAGTGSRRLVIRAVGPGLATFGVTGTMADPKLELYTGTTKINENDNWDATTLAAQQSVGAFNLTAGSRDAVLVTVLNPGPYTVQVTGGTNGVVLVEVYDGP